MKMNDTVSRIVEIMFQDVELNEETKAIQEEVMNNCQERYGDLVNSGLAEDDAIAAVIESLRGMEEVLAPYKKTQHVRNDVAGDDEPDGERDLVFSAGEIHQLNVSLVNEDIRLEPSDDDDYHVIWNADESPLVDVNLINGVLNVQRHPGEQANRKKSGHVDMDFSGDMDGFIKAEEGKIEFNMDNLSRAMKSLGEKIKLQFSNGMSIGIGTAGGEVAVQIPEKAIPHVRILTTSGDIDVQDVGLTALNITSTSGDVSIDLEASQYMDRIDARTISGDIEANAFVLGMTIASTSGDVEVEGRVTDLSISTISGDIDVRADVQNMTFKAVSGDVDMQFDSDELRTVNGSTVSGDIDVELPQGIGSMGISIQTRSGDVATPYHTSGVGSSVTGSVTSMSGDITIR